MQRIVRVDSNCDIIVDVFIVCYVITTQHNHIKIPELLKYIRKARDSGLRVYFSSFCNVLFECFLQLCIIGYNCTRKIPLCSCRQRASR